MSTTGTRNNVTVSLGATDPNSAVSGSEFFYKLTGGADQPWTKYTGPFTVSAEGSTDVVARSVDVNGNIEASKTDTIKIDKTAPTFALGCPSAPHARRRRPTRTISGATDDRLGLRRRSQRRPAGRHLAARATASRNEVRSRIGPATPRRTRATTTCATPTRALRRSRAGTSPNATGVFTLGWTRRRTRSSFGIRYTLQHRDADDADWSDVATGIDALSYAFAGSRRGRGHVDVPRPGLRQRRSA